MSRDTVSPTTNEHGDEVHPAFGVVRVTRPSGGMVLFGSEVRHEHYVALRISHASRRRDLHRDWVHEGKVVTEIVMSEAQWAGIVSGIGSSPVEVTLDTYTGEDGKLVFAPRIPLEDQSRLLLSQQETAEAARKAFEDIKKAHARVQEVFSEKKGVKEQRAALATLGRLIDQAPGNVEFASQSLTEHVENVTTKARADIEATMLRANMDPALGGMTPRALSLSVSQVPEFPALDEQRQDEAEHEHDVATMRQEYLENRACPGRVGDEPCWRAAGHEGVHVAHDNEWSVDQ